LNINPLNFLTSRYSVINSQFTASFGYNTLTKKEEDTMAKKKDEKKKDKAKKKAKKKGGKKK
jgi:hypothetical protein